ncbi:MAG: serine hydrolase, partial [Candidatus Solibacter sp.]
MTRREALALLALPAVCPAAEDMVAEWRRIASQVDGTVGVTAVNRSNGQRASLNGGDKFPLASVCKLPLAAHMLALVEAGKFSLTQQIDIPRADLYPPVSVIAERWEQQHRFPLDQMLEWMVAKSDNTAVQTLFRIGGGAPAMAARFKQWQVEGIRL